MMFIMIILLLILASASSLLVLLYLKSKHKKINVKKIIEFIKNIQKKKESQPKQEPSKNIPKSEEIEILEIYPKDKKTKANEDTLDLDDLFKTITMAAIEDDKEFDFGLQRTEKS